MRAALVLSVCICRDFSPVGTPPPPHRRMRAALTEHRSIFFLLCETQNTAGTAMRQAALPGSSLKLFLPTISLADARVWQIISLGILLTYGVGKLGFDQTPANIALIIATALGTQWVCARTIAHTAFDPLSPLITAFSLCLLLRASSPAVLALAAVLAIGSKFVLRFDGKHMFNPANFAIAVLLLLTDVAWISPAQWGSRTWAAFLFASLACLVLSRAKRGDIALAFIGTYLAILFGRALYLGDPMAIPMKQMQSGALLLFTFFMITDPKTTPDRRSARILFAALVAVAGAWLQFVHYLPQGLMYALFFASMLVPLFDRLFPRDRADVRFQWHRPVIN
jgi:Na+-translocating ferredoxin:NAD+ oxidoreductase RnfD subunit